jgi:hypothetical protein
MNTNQPTNQPTIVTALRPRLCLSWFKSAWLDFDDWQKKADISSHKKFD